MRNISYIKSKNKKRKNQRRPPNTFRYCWNCRKKQWFEYNPSIGHSQCMRCGLR